MSNDLRAPFFEAALRILGEDGYAGLKQAALCRAVGVTTGAFYHSFGSWRDFTGQLLDHWRRDRTTRLVELSRAYPDPVEQLEVLREATTTLPHRAEAAIRVWSALDPSVAAVQATVDAERTAVILAALARIVGDDEAPAYARASMAILIGFEQQPDADPDQLRWSLSLVLDAARASAASRCGVGGSRSKDPA